MIARHVNLGRVVIVVGGLLVVAALTSQIFAAGENPLAFLALFGVVIGGILALLLLGRTLGGWLAGRMAKDPEPWRREGMRWAVVLPVTALMLYRWFGLG